MSESLIRNLVVGLPAACGVPEGIAEIAGGTNGLMFDWEKEHPGSVLRRIEGISELYRLEPAFSLWEKFAEHEAVTYAKYLLVYVAKVTAFNSKGIGDKVSLETDRERLEEMEPDFPKIKALMTVEQASVLTSWN